MLIPRHTNRFGQPVGEANHFHRFTDVEVARARELRAAGTTSRAIAALIGCRHSTAFRWITQRAILPAVSLRVVRAKALAMPRHGRGPANFAWVNTPSSTCGLPPGLHDHHYSSAKCTTEVTHLECAPALTRASPYDLNLFNQAAYGLAGYRFNLIPK